MTDRTVTVIIPVYKTEKYLDRCLQSILGQSYPHLDIVIINDASPGNASELLEKYQKKDRRIRIVEHKRNRGLVYTRYHGVSLSRGDYIAFVDSDDYISYDYIRTLEELLEESGADIAVGCTVWEEQGNRFVYNLHESAMEFKFLCGKEVRDAYFGQETACYSWHTIWNKLYRKELWMKALRYLRLPEEPVVMGEDYLFSSILFYEAEKVVKAENDAYFYCRNPESATGLQRREDAAFRKGVSDLCTVFNTVEGYLKTRGAEKSLREHVAVSRACYREMWSRDPEPDMSAGKKRCRKEQLALLSPDENVFRRQTVFFRESVRTEWKGRLEYLKEQIGKGKEKYISFDILDTLIVRDFYEPSDLFRLLDRRYSELTGSLCRFSVLRERGEEEARQLAGSSGAEGQTGSEDITLEEIYLFLRLRYGIPDNVLEKLKEEEIGLELRHSHRRTSGWGLYRLAAREKKKIILVSDMYLPVEVIERILCKNGYSGYLKLFISGKEKKRKGTGSLFRKILEELPEARGSLLHVGDSWVTDVKGCEKAGIPCLFLPAAREIYENKVDGCPVNRCSTIGNRFSPAVDWKKYRDNFAVRCMQSLVSGRLFDDPYRTFHPYSDFHIHPFFLGYSILGMHLLGILKYLMEQTEKAGPEEICFCARDGYLPMKAYHFLQKSTIPSAVKKASYLPVSRRVLLPVLLNTKADFYDLPLEYRAHTPCSLMKLLQFASEKKTDQEILVFLRKHDRDPDKHFSTGNEFESFITFFLEECYDEDLHEESRKMVREYYSRIPEEAVLFDIGYSGRIPAALSRCLGRRVKTYYLHEDGVASVFHKVQKEIEIESLYPYPMEITGLLREAFLSEPGGGITGLRRQNGKVIPVYEKERMLYAEGFVIREIQRGALCFVKEYLERFGNIPEAMDFSPAAVSLPFEGFLRDPSPSEMLLFRDTFLEDSLYGGSSEILLEELFMQKLSSLKSGTENLLTMPDSSEKDYQLKMLNEHGKPVRAVLLFLTDRDLFLKKLRKNLPVLFPGDHIRGAD